MRIRGYDVLTLAKKTWQEISTDKVSVYAAQMAYSFFFALFPLLLFSQSRKRGQLYRAIGWIMIALMLLVAAYAFAPEGIRVTLAPMKPILVLEALLIWAFGLSWFEKGRELAAEEKANPTATEETRRVA